MKLIIDIPYEAYYTFKCDLEKGNLNALAEIVANGIPYEERLQGEWIPIKYRPMTSEERKEFAEHYGIEYCDTLGEKAFDCPMPEDRQRILISTLWGVDIDVADNDIDGEGFICYGLEGNGDWSGVIAWQPLPEPYKKGSAE